MELEEIKKHWEQAGEQFPTGARVTPTSRDPFLALLERKDILKHLKEFHESLEVGCGNGSHTLHYAAAVKRLTGIDVAESLIGIARKRMLSESIRNVDLAVGSVLQIGGMFRPCLFDSIISQRCLINLPDWQRQQDAILQVHSLLRENGLFLVTEGFQEGLDNLNAVRLKLGLAEIEVVRYNCYLTRKEFETFARKYFDIIDVQHYGAYLFLSRVFHPLAVLPDEPKHDSRLNEAAMEICRTVQFPDLEKYGYHSFYGLRKKSLGTYDRT